MCQYMYCKQFSHFFLLQGVQAQYASFALAAFYFLIFVLGMIPIVIRFICCNKVGHATNDEATPILSDASRRRTLS